MEGGEFRRRRMPTDGDGSDMGNEKDGDVMTGSGFKKGRGPQDMVRLFFMKYITLFLYFV